MALSPLQHFGSSYRRSLAEGMQVFDARGSVLSLVVYIHAETWPAKIMHASLAIAQLLKQAFDEYLRQR